MNPRTSILRADLLEDRRSAEAGGRQERHQMVLKEDVGAKSCRRELASAEHPWCPGAGPSCTWVSLTGTERLRTPLQETRVHRGSDLMQHSQEQRDPLPGSL